MGYQMSRDRCRHMTLKGQTRDPNTLRAQFIHVYSQLMQI